MSARNLENAEKIDMRRTHVMLESQTVINASRTLKSGIVFEKLLWDCSRCGQFVSQWVMKLPSPFNGLVHAQSAHFGLHERFCAKTLQKEDIDASGISDENKERGDKILYAEKVSTVGKMSQKMFESSWVRRRSSQK